MSWIDYRSDRCSSCFLSNQLCVCGSIVPIETATKVLILLASGEAAKPSNTGRLVNSMLRNSSYLETGMPGEPFNYQTLNQTRSVAESNSWLLFPSSAATIISPQFLAQQTNPVTLVVPDGTWRQSTRLGHKLIQRSGLKCLAVPQAGISRYSLRKNQRAGGLCTLEAVAQALRALEPDGQGELAASKLEELLELVMTRMRRMGTHTVRGNL